MRGLLARYARLQEAERGGARATAPAAPEARDSADETPPPLTYDPTALAPPPAVSGPDVAALPYDLRALMPPSQRTSASQTTRVARASDSACTLVAPTGRYRTHGAIALFQPEMAAALSDGIRRLNVANVVPTLTDGYRTAAMQRQRRAGPHPFGVAPGVSGHQVGLSADFGPRANAGNNDAIRVAMSQAGLRNGARFSTPDPLHYMMPNTARNQTAALARACAAAYRGRRP